MQQALYLAHEMKFMIIQPSIGINHAPHLLNQIDADTVEIHLADAGAPTLIRKDENSPALYVLMPMRV